MGPTHLYVGKNIVGMDYHLEQLKTLINNELNDVCMIVIYGIGGISKTTIAKAIYNEMSCKFEGSSFLKIMSVYSDYRINFLMIP